MKILRWEFSSLGGFFKAGRLIFKQEVVLWLGIVPHGGKELDNMNFTKMKEYSAKKT